MQDQPSVGSIRHSETSEPAGPYDPGADVHQLALPDLPRPLVEDCVIDVPVFRVCIDLIKRRFIIYPGLDYIGQLKVILQGARGCFSFPLPSLGRQSLNERAWIHTS